MGYLWDISGISWMISWGNLWDNFKITLGYLWNILGISWGYLGDIFEISGDILGISWGYFGISLGYLLNILSERTSGVPPVIFHTLEIVKPSTCFFSSIPCQAVWIVTTFGVQPHSAPITGAPTQITSRQSGC